MADDRLRMMQVNLESMHGQLEDKSREVDAAKEEAASQRDLVNKMTKKIDVRRESNAFGLTRCTCTGNPMGLRLGLMLGLRGRVLRIGARAKGQPPCCVVWPPRWQPAPLPTNPRPSPLNTSRW